MDSPTDSAAGQISESDGSYCVKQYLTSAEPRANDSPILICFHGSGTRNLKDWEELLGDLSQQYPTVFFDRGARTPSPKEHVKVLWNYLTKHKLRGPYILVAHSYGGEFAKRFLQAYHESVGGMVLVEAGKGGTTDRIQTDLIKHNRMGSKPLSVIKADSLRRQWEALEGGAYTGEALNDKMEWLKHCQDEDERLEKEQLKLSQSSKFIFLASCGHNVVVERPGTIVSEVQRVVEQCDTPYVETSWFQRMKRHLQPR